MTQKATATFSALIPRVVTGLILAAAAALLITLAPIWGLACVAALVAGLGNWEYERLTHQTTYGPQGVVATVLAVGLAFSGLAGAGGLAGAAGLALIITGLAAILAGGELAQAVESSAKRAWGVFYTGGLLGVVVVLAAGPHGRALVLFQIICVVAADVGAYFAGSYLGRHKLAPSISPGKSWEGVAGGLVLSGAVGAVFSLLWLPDTPVTAGLALALAMAAFSVGGDLLESAMKRARGVKDSSNLLPGHGGILDRVDGIVVAGPVLLLARVLFW